MMIPTVHSKPGFLLPRPARRWLEIIALCVLTHVAWNTAARGSDWPFQFIQGFSVPDFSLADGAVAFSDFIGGDSRVHLYRNGVWSVPGGDQGLLHHAYSPASTDGTSVVYSGLSDFAYWSIYRAHDDVVDLVFDFDDYLGAPVLASGKTLFSTFGSLYSDVSGQLEPVLTNSTPVPGGLGTFNIGFANPFEVGPYAFDGHAFAIYNDNPFQQGIYTNAGGGAAPRR